MLSKESIKKLKALGFDTKALIDAITNEAEVEFAVPEITSYSEEELSTRDENSKKLGIKEGKDTGIGIALKTIAKKLGIEGEFKEPDTLSEAISKAGKGNNSNEQVKLLQDRAEKAELDRDNAVNETKVAKRDAELLSNLPANRKSDLTDSEYLQLFKLSHQVVEEDGKIVVKKGDQVLREEKTQSAMSVKDAIHNMFNERKFIIDQQQQQDGRGGKDQQSGNNNGIKTYSAAETQWAKENPDKPLMGGEFQAYVQQLAKEPGFNING